MKMLIMGPQGAGKGTLAAILKKNLGIPHISMGDLLRETLKEDSLMAEKVRMYVNQGLLVPLDVVKSMLQSRLQMTDCQPGFILDGFPRDKAQADILDDLVKIDLVVLLEVPHNVSIERLRNRLQCQICGAIYNIVSNSPKVDGICDICGGELYRRQDDSEVEAVEKRLHIYETETDPLMERYTGKLMRLDTTIESMTDIVQHIFSEINRSSSMNQ